MTRKATQNWLNSHHGGVGGIVVVPAGCNQGHGVACGVDLCRPTCVDTRNRCSLAPPTEPSTSAERILPLFALLRWKKRVFVGGACPALNLRRSVLQVALVELPTLVCATG